MKPKNWLVWGLRSVLLADGPGIGQRNDVGDGWLLNGTAQLES